MANPVVLVTGALTGIGRATAVAFAREQARLVISGRKDAVGAALVQELRALGATAEYVAADVRRESDVENLVNQTRAFFGRLDVAVNNAGTEGRTAPLIEQTVENYSATFDTNVLGTLLSMKYELRVMLDQRQGSIINVSSFVGGRGSLGASIYSASKHAVEGLTKSAALEAASRNVRVNAVAPGPIDTEMLGRFAVTAERKAALIAAAPLKRMGLPEEVAQAIVFLASDKASFITGQIMGVDGGKKA